MNPPPSKDARPTAKRDPWVRLRKALDEADTVQVERRRAEDRIREEWHDACAKTIAAGRPVEQRERRSDTHLRARREEQKRQWDEHGRGRKNKRPR